LDNTLKDYLIIFYLIVMAPVALPISHHMNVSIILQGNRMKRLGKPCCLANFPLYNAHQYHWHPPLHAELATVVHGDLRNTEALVADASWYLMPKVPATSNECYTHTRKTFSLTS